MVFGGPFDADGTAITSQYGLGVGQDEVVYLGGPKEVDAGPMKAAEAILPAAAIDIDANGEVVAAAAGASAMGYALENLLMQDIDGLDGHSVLDAYADGDEIAFNYAQDSKFAAVVTIAQDGTDLTPGCPIYVGAGQTYVTTDPGSGVAVAKYVGKDTVAANVATGGAKTQRVALLWMGGI